MRCISDGGPGMTTMILPSRSTHHPGAVPLGLGMDRADGMRVACLMLEAGISRPIAANMARRSPKSSGETDIFSPSTRATASRVRSSWVGPRPPVASTTANRCQAWPNASVRRSRLSGRTTMD